MAKAKIVAFSEVKVGDMVCKTLGDVVNGLHYKVLYIGASKDKKGPIVSLQLERYGYAHWGPHWHNSSPDDLVILVHRPWADSEKQEVTRQDELSERIENIVKMWLHIRKPAMPYHLNLIQQAIEEYELGKPLPAAEPAKK